MSSATWRPFFFWSLVLKWYWGAAQTIARDLWQDGCVLSSSWTSWYFASCHHHHTYNIHQCHSWALKIDHNQWRSLLLSALILNHVRENSQCGYVYPCRRLLSIRRELRQYLGYWCPCTTKITRRHGVDCVRHSGTCRQCDISAYWTAIILPQTCLTRSDLQHVGDKS